MSTQANALITPEEYLKRERAALEKSEYYRGEVFAMAGASRVHSLIVSNFVVEIGSQLRQRDCEIHSGDIRLLVSETGLYTYPDIMVVCGKPVLVDEHFDILTNPSVIIEVLSKSTEDYGRGRKFHQYMRIPSLGEYLMVSQTEMSVFHSIRQIGGEWTVKQIDPEAGKVSLAALGIELSFADIYLKVEFPA